MIERAINDDVVSRDDIEQRLARLKFVERVRAVALPLAAVGASAGIFIPGLFPAVAGVAAGAVFASELFSRYQRKIIEREIEGLKTEGSVSKKVINDLSSSINRLTVAGPSG